MNSRLLPPRFRRVVLSGYIFFCACGGHAQSPAPIAPPSRSAPEGPFVPAPALPGGIVLALYPPDSPLLKRERIHEAETYNSTTGGVTPGGKVQSTLNIHNPSIEVHLAPGRTNTGAAIIVINHQHRRAGLGRGRGRYRAQGRERGCLPGGTD
jgi:hypothetical protein